MKTSALKIAEPCKVDWTKMTPADGGRFCGDCQKVVKNLSSMTEREAKKVLRTASEGQLCVRFVHDKHGNVFFGPDAPRPDFVPASMLSRAKRAIAVAGLAAATQACASDNEASIDASKQPVTLIEEPKDDGYYESMGGISSDGYDDLVASRDAGSDDQDHPTTQDGGVAAADAGPSEKPPTDPAQDGGVSNGPN